jgi:hypothetical protein
VTSTNKEQVHSNFVPQANIEEGADLQQLKLISKRVLIYNSYKSLNLNRIRP